MTTLLKKLERSRLLDIFLQGALTALKRTFEFHNFVLETDESGKRTKDTLASADQHQLTYPYAYAVLSDLSGIRDRANSKAQQMIGTRLGSSQTTRGTTMVGRFFPVKIGLAMHYLDADPMRNLTFACACAILSTGQGITYQVKIGSDDYYLEGRIEFPDTSSIPLGESNEPQEPGALKLEVPLILHLYTGWTDQVSAVNSDKAIVTEDMVEIVSGGLDDI